MSSPRVGDIMSRKFVTNEQIDAALAVEDNMNIIRKVTAKYASVIHYDDLRTCGLNALWRTLQCHDPSYNQKFTTSLYRFVEWECQRELRRKRTKVLSLTVPLEQAEPHEVSAHAMPSADVELVREVISAMDEQDREIIHFHFLEGHSLRDAARRFGFSKQVARKKKQEALEKLRERLINHAG
jgi:RNA polymerase sigma factor (sigma-70 family)